jgi:hypothetical protein
MTSIRKALSLASAFAFLGTTGAAPSVAQVIHPASAEDVSYAALDELPDWRGIWLPTGGTRPSGDDPVLIGEYQARRTAEDGVPRRASNCAPPGMPTVMTQPYSLEFLFTPGRVTIIQEAYMQVRRVFTDGRALPEAPDPAFNGHSVGRWDGDTLVIETIGIDESVPLVRGGVWHGPDLRITERIFLDEADRDLLHLEVTLEDPDALAEPWHTRASFRRSREWDQIEFICAENDRNPVDADGNTQFILRD